jgi:ubiquitin carboxyl-terminal hydrolase 8
MISDSSDNCEKIEREQEIKAELANDDNFVENERKKITVLGLSGIVNIGNTCYMNSALQCLSASDLLTSYLVGTTGKQAPYKNDLKNGVILELMKKKKCEFDDITENEIRKGFRESLTYALRNLFVIMWNENCKVKPKTFKERLGEKRLMFMGYQQHDSQECLSFIIDKIHEETKTDAKVKFIKMNEEQEKYAEFYEKYQEDIKKEGITKEEKLQIYRQYVDFKKDKMRTDALISSLFFWKSFLKYNHSVIIDIFTGLFITQINCNNCLNTSIKFDPYNIISLPIPIPKIGETYTLEKCLETYFKKEEKLKDDNKYSCDYCDCKTEADMKTELWSSPSRLIIQFKRFTAHGMRINTDIKFPVNNLNIGSYFNEYVSKDVMYELYGVIMHRGNMHFGHYVAFTKNPINEEWYHFDDSNVLHIPKDKIEGAIQNSEAYVLFYKKRILQH